MTVRGIDRGHHLAAFAALLIAAAPVAQPAVISAVDEWTAWTGAADAPRMLASSTAGRVQVWDTQHHVAVRTFDDLREAVLSPDGTVLAGNAPHASDIDVFRVDDGATVSRIVHPAGGQRALAISPDDRMIAVEVGGSDARQIEVVRAATGAIAYRLPGAGGGAAFSPDGETLATLEPKRRFVLLWDARSGRFAQRLTGAAGVFGPPLFSPDNRYLLTVANPPRTPPHSDGSFAINSIDYPELHIEVWDRRTGRVVRDVPFWNDPSYIYDESPGYVAFAGAQTFVASSRNAPAVVADIGSAAVRQLAARGFAVPAGNSVQMIDSDVWTQFSSGVLHPALRLPHLLDITGMAVSAGGLLAVAAEKHVLVWDLRQATLRCSTLLDQPAYRVSFASAAIIDVQTNGSLRLDASTCKPASRAPAARSADEIVSADGSRVLRFAAADPAGRASARLEVRVAQTNALVTTVPDIVAGFGAPQFALRAPVAVLQTNHTPQHLIVLDAATGTIRLIVDDGSFALSPDGATLAVAGSDGTTVYDTVSGRITGRAQVPEGTFSFLSRGPTLAVLSSGGTLRFCSLAGSTIATLSLIATGDADPAWVIALPTGEFLASSEGAEFVHGGRADGAAVRAALAAAGS